MPGAVDGWCELHARFGRAAAARAARALDRLRARGLPRDGSHRRVTGPPVRSALQEAPGLCRGVHAERPRARASASTFANPRSRVRTRSSRATVATRSTTARSRRPSRKRCARQRRLLRRARISRRIAPSGSSPSSTTYRGWSVFELPPNGQGIAVLQMLNMLEGFDLARSSGAASSTCICLIEAKKLAFEDRARFYADPEVRRRARRAAHLEGLRGRTPRADRSATAPCRRPRHGDPAALRGRRHGLSRDGRRGRQHGLADPEQLHGLRLRHDGRAVRLRSAEPRLAFALDPKHANAYAPGKRPFHTIIPAFAHARRRSLLSASASWAPRCSRRGTCRC